MEKDPLDDFFENHLDLYELMDLTQLERSKMNTNMSSEELSERAKKVFTEGVPETKEEQIGFVLSSLKRQAEENPQQFIGELYSSKKRDIGKRLRPYEEYEREVLKPVLREIRRFTDNERDIIGDWLSEFHDSEVGQSYSQQYHQLVEKELGRDRKLSIETVSDLKEGIEIYSDTMNICDAGYPIPVALHWVSTGDDPRQKNAISMGFKRGLQELEEAPYSAVSEHIDTNLRNGIKHGDYIIDPKKRQLRIEGGNREYSFVDVEIAVNNSLFAIDSIQVMDIYVSLIDYRSQFSFLE